MSVGKLYLVPTPIGNLKYNIKSFRSFKIC